MLLLISSPCRGQNTGSAETTGTCSPAVTGNNNQFTINCRGLSKEQGDKMISILNKIVEKQLDPEKVMVRLEEMQKSLGELAAKYTETGDLLGAGEVFSDGQLRAAPMVQIGATESTFVMIPSEKLQPYFKPFSDAEFRVEYGIHGPMVSTTIRDSEGHIVASVDKNHWKVYPPFCQEVNYTKEALEILDSSLHVVLQVRLFSDRVQVQGEWWDNQGHGLRISASTDPKRGQVAPLGPQMKRNEALIAPMFKYPSKNFQGQFLER
jgi:hypothetical protein